MKTIRLFLLVLSTMLMLWVPQGRAEDIDIYTGSAGSEIIPPNVVFIIDTGADFGSSAAVPCVGYGGDSSQAPSLGTTVGGVEQCALVDAILSLPDDKINVAILVGNSNNFANSSPAVFPDTTVAADHALCNLTPGPNLGAGGCLLRPLKLMSSTNKADLIAFIKSWKLSGADTATDFIVKSGQTTAGMMQEAWAYYNGKVGMSGTNYQNSILSSGCQKNFVIFIGNSFSNSGKPATESNEKASNSVDGIASTPVGATSAQLAKITTPVKFTESTCGVTDMVATTSSSDWSSNYGDEWARLMFQQDGDSSLANSQSITTYTIGVVHPSGACAPDFPALLSSMATNGGGKYFKTSNAEDVKNALLQILNEIQAVNSVFASASLPVSVNAQGTFLNQIFLGMFRPDASASPRWLGNLKQYQLIKVGDTLVLGDAGDPTGLSGTTRAPMPAISASGTGFIKKDAISFWTTKNTSIEPDSAGGFFVNKPTGDPVTGFDLPDGDLVEKGGAAQQIRIENLKASFSTYPAGVSSNPRRLYSYCPAQATSSGASCQDDLTHADNAFVIGNTTIPSDAFGTGSSVGITSIVRKAPPNETVADVTTNGSHGFGAIGSTPTVTISNVTQVEYTGARTITVTGPTTFTISGIPVNPPAGAAAGTYRISNAGGIPVNIVSMTRQGIGAATETVTVTTDGNHGFEALLAVNPTLTFNVSGAAQDKYNGTKTLLSATGNTLTFSVSTLPSTAVASPTNYRAVFNPSVHAQVTVSLVRRVNASLVEITTSGSHGFHVGQTVKLTGAGATFNGTFTVASISSASQFRVNKAIAGSPADATAGFVQASVATPGDYKNFVTLSRSGDGGSAIATATGLPANWFGTGINANKAGITINKSGASVADESLYLKSSTTITCTVADCSTFTYPITVEPAVTATAIPGETMKIVPTGAVSHDILAGDISRTGTTATISNLPGAPLLAGTYTISATGTIFSNESAYTGNKTISCTGACTSATFPVEVSPKSPATGSNKQAYIEIPPARDPIINWVRGEDNRGDELGPCLSATVGGPCTATVRPSVHGDVLHSRPVVINYGDSRGLVVYYGANDGVFRAVNGSQTAALSGIPAGGELWGLVLPEHYKMLNRQRQNSPELRLRDTPAELIATTQPKDYAVDGPTGSLQRLNADGSIAEAILYLTMRRGGRNLVALNVTNPLVPSIKFPRIVGGTTGFEELGQTWSLPRVTIIEGLADPVIIFGAGYDTAEDTEPPSATKTMGRGIFVVNARTGALIWKAVPGVTAGCTSSGCVVPGLTHAVPSDLTLRDRNSNGKTDKAYFGDMGGNVWRVDFVTSTNGSPGTASSDPSKWRVTKLASLGCDNGTVPAPTCGGTKSPRKFFFAPTVVSVGATGTASSYDAVLIGSGDREHPLTSQDDLSAHKVDNRFYMIKDTVTSATPKEHADGVAIDGLTVRTESTLFQAFRTVAMSNVVRVGGTTDQATVTTAVDHGFVVGDIITIDNVKKTDGTFYPAVEGQHKIVSVTANTFTFDVDSDATDLPSTAVTGSATIIVPFLSSNTEPGFYGHLSLGEKVVNAPLTVGGTTFFGTNRPFTPEGTTCKSNLGEARGYAFNPFTGSFTSVVYDGGGLPPSGVAGVVSYGSDTDSDTTSSSTNPKLERFCIGCGGGADCNSALEQCSDPVNVPKKPTRTYWYRK